MFALSFKAGMCTSEQPLPDSLENSMCRTEYLNSILHSVLHIADAIDFRSTKNRLDIHGSVHHDIIYENDQQDVIV